MTQAKALYQFLRDPGFTPEELATTLRVLQTIFDVLPPFWDNECPDMIKNILAHFVEGVPLAEELLEFCEPDEPSITIPRLVLMPDDPWNMDKDGYLPDDHWQPVYDVGTRVNVFRLLRHTWLPDDIRAMAEAAKQSYEAECAEQRDYFRARAAHGISQ